MYRPILDIEEKFSTESADQTQLHTRLIINHQEVMFIPWLQHKNKIIIISIGEETAFDRIQYPSW